MSHTYFLSREALAAALDESLSALEELVAAVDGATWQRPTANPGWTLHDTLAHLAAAGHGLLATVERFLAGRALPADFNLDYWNQRQVEKRRHRSPTTLLAEVQAAHAEAKTRLYALSNAQLAVQGRHPSGATISVAGVFYLLAIHEWDHMQDMARALDIPWTRVASWQDPFRKDRLWWRLEAIRQEVKTLITDLSPAAWRTPVTEHWTVQDVIAHLASAEQGHVAVGWALLRGEPTTVTDFDLDTFNRRETAKRRGLSMAARLAELDAARAQTAALLAAVGPEDWDKAGPHPGGFDVTVEGIFKVIRVHEQRHLRDVQKALAKGTLPTGKARPEG